MPVGSGFTDSHAFSDCNISVGHGRLRPTLLNELRFSTNRSATFDAVPTNTTSPSALGFTTVIQTIRRDGPRRLISVGGAFSLGPSPQGPTKDHDSYVSISGHTLLDPGQARVEVRRRCALGRADNFNYDFYNNGSFDFGTYYTNTGSALADFVGGYYRQLLSVLQRVVWHRSHQLYFFGQDAWKITRNLSLDYGLRYEYDSPQTDPHNQIMGWYPGQHSTPLPRRPSQFFISGRSGNTERGLIYPNRE